MRHAVSEYPHGIIRGRLSVNELPSFSHDGFEGSTSYCNKQFNMNLSLTCQNGCVHSAYEEIQTAKFRVDICQSVKTSSDDIHFDQTIYRPQSIEFEQVEMTLKMPNSINVSLKAHVHIEDPGSYTLRFSALQGDVCIAKYEYDKDILVSRI
jgi:hypothetical protein